MKRIYVDRLKKLSVNDIINIRLFYRAGRSIDWLTKRFGVSKTTITWHLGELNKKDYEEVI